MKVLKTLALAASMGLCSTAALAVPLGSLAGTSEWKLNGLTTETNVIGGTGETTWGIGAVTGISSLTGGNWAAGEGGTYLYYMIYGIADLNIIGTRTLPGSGPANNFDIYNIGASGVFGGKIHIDIYQSAVQIAAVDQTFSASPTGRTGFDSYSLFAGLTKYLTLELGTGKVVADVGAATNGTSCGVLAPFETCETSPGTDESVASLLQRTTSTTLPTTGSGTFFADVTGGTAQTKWDTNGQSLGYDFDGNFTIKPQSSTRNCGLGPNGQGCFDGVINDPLAALAVPEPGSVVLVALGLLGLAGVSRRGKNNAA